MPLQSAGANTDKITVPASASVNNLHTGSALLVVNMTTFAPAAQRNFWGKSTGANRNVGFISATSVITLQYGAGTGGTLLSMATAVSGLSMLVAGRWVFIGYSWSQGGAVGPRAFGGSVLVPMTETTSYTTQDAGAAGSPNHDDSAVALDLFNSSAGSTAAIPGQWAVAQFWNRQFDVYNMRLAQTAILNSQPPPLAPVGAWMVGGCGTTVVLDTSGNGNHGLITGATQSGERPIAASAPQGVLC